MSKIIIGIFMIQLATFYVCEKKEPINLFCTKINDQQFIKKIDTNLLCNHWILTKKKIQNLNWTNEFIGKEHFIFHSKNSYIALSEIESQPTAFAYSAGKWKLRNDNYIGICLTDQNGQKQETCNYSYRWKIIELSKEHLILRIQSRDGFIYYYYEPFLKVI